MEYPTWCYSTCIRVSACSVTERISGWNSDDSIPHEKALDNCCKCMPDICLVISNCFPKTFKFLNAMNIVSNISFVKDWVINLKKVCWGSYWTSLVLVVITFCSFRSILWSTREVEFCKHRYSRPLCLVNHIEYKGEDLSLISNMYSSFSR